MHREPPPLGGLDLNLLVALRALLREASVTRAAARLGQTQPTVSRALATLRTAFDDPLLVRAGRGMALTPLAESLRTPLERALAALDRLGTVGTFAPAAADRVFRLILPDIAGLFVVAPLVERVASEAPGVRLHVVGSEGDALRALLEDQVDLVVGALVLDHPELVSRRAGAPFAWSVVTGPQGPSTMDLDTWLAATHVQVTPSNRPDVPGVVDRLLEARGLTRHVAVKLGYVAAAPAVLARTSFLITLPTPMAREVARHPGLRLLPHPLSDALPPLTLRTTWHQVHHRDPGHAWLRALVAETVGALA